MTRMNRGEASMVSINGRSGWLLALALATMGSILGRPVAAAEHRQRTLRDLQQHLGLGWGAGRIGHHDVGTIHRAG